MSLKLSIGLDRDESEALRPLVTAALAAFDLEVFTFDFPRGSICRLWRALAREAYDQGREYLVLLGDDVELKTDGWATRISHAFKEIAEERGLPLGLACVAFEDATFPGFPTFPVVHRRHVEALGGEIFSDAFVNQDADPFLFQLYRRFGASRLLCGEAVLTNGIGGAREARYDKVSTHWTTALLDSATDRVESFLDGQVKGGGASKRVVTVDVGVPSYRVELKSLARILDLEREAPEGMDVGFILVVDDPHSPAIEELKHRFERNPRVKIRVNKANLGASGARNRILEESAADWVLFLDDDVAPSPGILKGVLAAIQESQEKAQGLPEVVGLVGSTSLPPPVGVFTSAVLLSGCAFFWDAASHWPSTKPIPWGVTANLLIKRSPFGVRFDLAYPKTGGGEDIAFCLDKCSAVEESGEGILLPAPEIHAEHPWWRNGHPDFRRFFMWAFGDSLLIERYPRHAYQDVFLNGAELIVLSIGLGLVGGLTLGHQVALLMLAVVPSVIVGEMLHDLIRYQVREPHAHPSVTPGSRVRLLASIVGALIRLASEFGRLVGPVARGSVPPLMGRFDWFAGLHPPAVAEEKRMRLERLALTAALYAVLLAKCGLY